MRPALISLLAAALVVSFAQPLQAQSAQPAAKASKPAKPAKSSRSRPAPEPTEPATLDPELLAVAPLVMVGDSDCEFGRRISVKAHPTLEGRFLLEGKGLKHVLTPTPTTTGVIRLEERRSGMVWLQVPIKSMLLDGKKGQRVADNCLHPTQAAEVEASRAQSTATQ